MSYGRAILIYSAALTAAVLMIGFMFLYAGFQAVQETKQTCIQNHGSMNDHCECVIEAKDFPKR